MQNIQTLIQAAKSPRSMVREPDHLNRAGAPSFFRSLKEQVVQVLVTALGSSAAAQGMQTPPEQKVLSQSVPVEQGSPTAPLHTALPAEPTHTLRPGRQDATPPRPSKRGPSHAHTMAFAPWRQCGASALPAH